MKFRVINEIRLSYGTHIHNLRPTHSKIFENGDILMHDTDSQNGNVWFYDSDGERGKIEYGSIANLIESRKIERIT